MGAPQVFHPLRCLPVVLVLAATAITSPAFAATRTWIGGAPNQNWSTSGNWAGGLVPVDGDIVNIPGSATTGVGINNISGLQLLALVIGRAYALSGNQIDLINGLAVTGLGSGDGVAIGAPLRLAANANFLQQSAGAQVTINSPILLNGHTLTYTVSAGAELRCNSIISGTGAVIKEGPGDLRMSGNSNFAGPVTINQGYLYATHEHALGFGDGTPSNGTVVKENGAIAGTLVLVSVAIGNEAMQISGGGHNENGALQSSGSSSIAGPIRVPADLKVNVIFPGRLDFDGSISGAGRICLMHDGVFTFSSPNNSYTGGLGIGECGDAASKVVLAADEAIPFTPVQHLPQASILTIDAGRKQTFTGLTGTGTARVLNASSQLILDNDTENSFAGTLNGPGTLRHTGTGTSTFTGNLFGLTGSLLVEAGTVNLLGLNIGGDVTVHGGATLMEKGSVHVETLTLQDGTLRLPESTNGGGSIAYATNFVMTSGASLIVDTANGGDISKMAVSGAVQLDGKLTVTLAPTFVGEIGGEYLLISNGGSDPVAGTFANLPQGATLETEAGSFQITYAGGDGNDVMMTLISVARDYLLSEGASGSFFITDILIANPDDEPAPVRVQFLKPGGGTVDLYDEVPAMSRRTITANSVQALDVSEFSTVVRSLSGQPLIVERTMSWNQAAGYGAHTERAASAASTTWYFAEGSQGFFSTFLLLANPAQTPSVATVTYLLEAQPPVIRSYEVPPLSRRTVDAAADPALVNQSFGMSVSFTQPGLAERAMYFGVEPLWNGGHASAGVTSAGTTAFIAEGATGPFFETFILVANPNPWDVDLTLTFGRQADAPIVMSRTVSASSRMTLNLETLDPGLANTPVSTSIVATAPVVVERAQYWPDPAPNWYEAHGSPALREAGLKWGLAEGRVGGPANYQTYILLANTSATAATNVSITFLRESGAPFTKTFTVPATQRFNVSVGPGTEVPELNSERFGALITSDQPIVVERAMYSDAPGQIWAAGTSASATPVP